MISYDKYERGSQHPNGGHQRITYKKKKKNKIKIKIIFTLRLTQSKWVGVDHADRIHLLNSPPMTGSDERIKMVAMMTMMIYKW